MTLTSSPLISLKQVASKLGVTRYQVSLWLKQGLVPPPLIRLRRQSYWTEEVIDYWLADYRNRIESLLKEVKETETGKA
jgi:predicted DNA-binding transcriptional regulator AlpA